MINYLVVSKVNLRYVCTVVIDDSRAPNQRLSDVLLDEIPFGFPVHSQVQAATKDASKGDRKASSLSISFISIESTRTHAATFATEVL